MFAKSNACPGLPHHPGCLQIPLEPSNSYLSVPFLFQPLFPLLFPPALPAGGASTSSPSSLAAGAEGKAVLRGGKCSAPALPGQPRRSWAPSKLLWPSPSLNSCSRDSNLFLRFFVLPRPTVIPANRLREQRDSHKTPSCCCLTILLMQDANPTVWAFPSGQDQRATLQISCHRQRPSFGM